GTEFNCHICSPTAVVTHRRHNWATNNHSSATLRQLFSAAAKQSIAGAGLIGPSTLAHTSHTPRHERNLIGRIVPEIYPTGLNCKYCRRTCIVIYKVVLDL